MPRSIHEGRYRARATPQHVGVLPTEIPIPEDERNPVPEIEAAGLAWYVCTTVPQGERRAAASLRREGDRLIGRGRSPLVPYVPCRTEWVRRKRGATDLPRREVQTPIARSYVFVGIVGGITGAHLHALAERDHEHRNRHGLGAILGVDGQAKALGEAGRRFLSRCAQAERDAAKVRVVEGAYEAGDSVHITDGAFATFEARVVAVDAEHGRLLSEVEIFGRMTPIELDFCDVRKVA